MNKRTGPKRRKGSSGLVGMGRGDLAQGGGIISRKPLPTKFIQEKNDKVGLKSRAIEKSQAGFALRARLAKPTKPGTKNS